MYILDYTKVLIYTSVMNNSSFEFSSDLLLNKGKSTFLNSSKVKLLENIRDFGSMTKAAKELGITYKTAWSWIDKMNMLASTSLVEKISGGKGGGGTIITPYAKDLMKIYHEVKALQDTHLQSLQDSLQHLDDDISKKTFSFSNLNAYIKNLSKQDNRYEVILVLKNGSELISYVSTKFVEVNELKVDSKISVLVESNSISLSKLVDEHLSSRNKLKTKVINIIKEDEDVLLELELSKGQFLTSRITLQSFQSLNIKKEDVIMAIFKAYNITLFKGEDR